MLFTVALVFIIHFGQALEKAVMSRPLLDFEKQKDLVRHHFILKMTCFVPEDDQKTAARFVDGIVDGIVDLLQK